MSIFVFEVKQSQCTTRGERCSLLHQAHLSSYQTQTDCSDGWTHTLMIYSPSTNSLSYLSWWTSFFSLSSTLYSRSSEQVISSGTVRLPSPWAVCPGGVTLLFLGLESLLDFKKPTHCVHLTFSHCHDGTLLHIKLLYTHTRTLTTAWLLVLLHLHGWGTT